MISKALLSEVLKLDVKELEFNFKYNYIRYGYWNSCVNNRNEDISGVDYLKINIYELAHKCKEWVLKQGYYFSTYSFNFDSNTEQEHRIRLLIGNDVVYFGNDSSMETEVEAIFNACQWILDKDSK